MLHPGNYLQHQTKVFCGWECFHSGEVCAAQRKYSGVDKWEAIKSELNPEECDQRRKFAWMEASISVCVTLAGDELGRLTVMEYLWIGTMWNTLQKRHQL